MPSRHTLFSVAFTTNIAESNFRYTHGGPLAFSSPRGPRPPSALPPWGVYPFFAVDAVPVLDAPPVGDLYHGVAPGPPGRPALFEGGSAPRSRAAPGQGARGRRKGPQTRRDAGCPPLRPSPPLSPPLLPLPVALPQPFRPGGAGNPPPRPSQLHAAADQNKRLVSPPPPQQKDPTPEPKSLPLNPQTGPPQFKRL